MYMRSIASLLNIKKINLKFFNKKLITPCEPPYYTSLILEYSK